MIFKELKNIDTWCCLLGLQFPESVTEFQRATLTLAHLMACVRDYILKGYELPTNVILLIVDLCSIIDENSNKQK